MLMMVDMFCVGGRFWSMSAAGLGHIAVRKRFVGESQREVGKRQLWRSLGKYRETSAPE